MKNSEQPINPMPYENRDGTIQHDVYFGLTKREYFAAMAMQALISKGDYINYNSKTAADYAITYADELLRKFEK